jgi:hypothetical protein
MTTFFMQKNGENGCPDVVYGHHRFTALNTLEKIPGRLNGQISPWERFTTSLGAEKKSDSQAASDPSTWRAQRCVT